jgi:hypothetical protein
VTIGGGRAREIHIVVDIQKLNSYGLSIAQVRDAISAENIEVPGGTVEQGKGQLLLRTLGRIDATEDFNNVVVATMKGTPIRISDIGRAEDGFERPTTAVWLGDKPAVMLDIRRAMGENTVSVIEGVRDRLKTIQKSLPPLVTVTVIRDGPGFVAPRVVAHIVNVACEIAQARIATPGDIDRAVTLGLGYRKGPLAMGDAIGAPRVLALLEGLLAFYGDPRYRPSAWLRRRAMLGVPLGTPEP